MEKRNPEEIVTGESVYEASNENESPLLVKDNVCPAPKHTIIQIADAMISKVGGDSTQSELENYFTKGEFSKLTQFSLIADGFQTYWDKKKGEREKLEEFGRQPIRAIQLLAQEQLTALDTEIRQEIFRVEEKINPLLGRTM